MSWLSVSLAGGASPADFVRKSGDTMTGPLTLSGPPTQPGHAVTKDYVDGISGNWLASSGGKMTGVLTMEFGTARIEWRDTGTGGRARIKLTGDTAGGKGEGHLLVDFETPTGSPAKAMLRLFRETTGTNDAQIEVFRGDGTGTLVHKLTTAGDNYLAVTGGRVAIGHTSPQATLDIGGTVGVLLPRGTTAERPLAPPIGTLRYNTDTQGYEVYTSGGWSGVGGSGVASVEPHPRYEKVSVGNGASLLLGHGAEQLEVVGGKVREVNKVVEVTGTGNVSVTLPAAGVEAGFMLHVRNGATGQLTINAPSGSTVNGGSSVAVPWVGGTVLLTAVAVSGGNVTWEAVGDTAEGVVLPRAKVRGELVLEGEVSGGRSKVRPTITANTTLDPVEDVGTIRHVNGASVTVTVPVNFRGRTELVFDTAGTVAFSGGPSKAVGAGKSALVDVHEVDSTVYRRVGEVSWL